MKKKILILVFLLLFSASLSSAETIQLKSGKTIEGKIVEKTDKYIKVDIGIGVPITYFLDDIVSIDGQEIGLNRDISPTTPQINIAPQPSNEINSGSYVDESTQSLAKQHNYFIHESGLFRFVPPDGFNEKRLFENGVEFREPTSNSSFRVQFSYVNKVLSPEAMQAYPDTGVVELLNDKGLRDEFVKSFLEAIYSRGIKSEIIDEKRIDMNGIPAWEFITEAIFRSDLMKVRTFVISKNGKEFIIHCGTQKAFFNSKDRIFEEALKTFEILQ